MNPSRPACAALLAFSLLYCPSAPAAEPRAAVDARRDALRSRIERLRSELAEAEEDRNETREELRDSERAISAVNRSLKELSRRRETARGEVASLAAKKKQVETDLSAREREVGRLLAAIYVTGEPGALKLLLSGSDPNQTARDLHYLSYVSRAHAALVDSLRADLAGLADLESRVTEASSEIAALEREQKSARDELVRQQAARRKVLKQISGKMSAQRREVKMLEGDQERLARLVERISRAIEPLRPGLRNDAVPEKNDSAGTFSNLKGRLRLPVKGVLTHRFGGSRTGGGPAWKGLFIGATQGTEVRAVAAGEVVFADWMRGYGNLLILDHGSGYLTIYGNNESLLKGVGDRVAAAEPISTVGASGGGEETGLYFEVRHEGKAFDPMAWVMLR